jgi:hypothetical protein
MGWIGHVVRMDLGRSVKIYENELMGSRREARPK